MRECSPSTTCYMSCVTCHVSHVTCHMACVTCHFFFFRQSGESYRWRVCYQRGLPRLVFINIYISYRKNGLSGGASRWRVCYQRGLPRLVSTKKSHLTHGRGWKFFRNFSFLALMVWDKQCFGVISTKYQSVSDLMAKVFVEQPRLHWGC